MAPMQNNTYWPNDDELRWKTYFEQEPLYVYFLVTAVLIADVEFGENNIDFEYVYDFNNF